MTAAKNGTYLTDMFAETLEDLSDAAFRLHIEALCWSSYLERDQVIPKQYLNRVTAVEDPEHAAAELVDRGWWRDTGKAWDISDRSGKLWSQTTASVRALQRARARDRTIRRKGNVNDKVFTRDGHRCVQCGATDTLTVDHIVPQALGGSCTGAEQDMDNLQTLCRRCNSRKGVKTEAAR